MSIYTEELNQWFDEMYEASPASVSIGLGGSPVRAVMGDSTLIETATEGGMATVVAGLVFVRRCDIAAEPKAKSQIVVDGRPARVVNCVLETNDPIYKIFYEKRF